MSVKQIVMAAAGALGGGGGENQNAWDVSKAYYDVDRAGELSTAIYPNIFFATSPNETLPTGLFFKPDGTKMYIIGSTSNNVSEYSLSTAWLVNTASYVQNFNVSAQETSPTGLSFKPDGTKMYVIGNVGNNVNEYSLSTPWNVSTASYVQNFSVVSQSTGSTEIFFKPDGTKMYVLDNGGDNVYEYSLSTAWNISTASYVQSFLVQVQEGNPQGLFFNPSGTKMYVIGINNDEVKQYNLSTAWDISTASFIQAFLITGSNNPNGLFFNPDEGSFYVVDKNFYTIYQYALGGFYVRDKDTAITDLFFKTDGTKMYTIGYSNDRVYEYSLSTAWDLDSASYVQFFYIGSQDTIPQSLFFKPDGTKMYCVGATSDNVSEYNLSVAWDISSSSYFQNFYVGSQEANPFALFFKDDGTKMYILGSIGDDVNEYNLSTPWNVSTASYSKNFYIGSQEATPTGLSFKADGTKMYVIGNSSDNVNEYNLSTAWDVGTASYVQNFYIGNQSSFPAGMFFRPDGTQFFIIDGNPGYAKSFLISPI